MRKYLRRCQLALLFSFILTASFSFSQTCGCEKELAFAKDYIEGNYAGYKDKVTDKNRPEYESLKQSLLRQAQSTGSNAFCLILINKYLAFFKDRHIQLSSKEKELNERDTSAVRAVLNNTEKIEISEQTLKALKANPAADIEGIYNYSAGNYKIAILKSKTASRDYAGVVLKARNKLWKPNMVKFEMKQINDSIFEVVSYNKFHTPLGATYTLSAGVLKPEDFVKEGVKAPKEPEDNEFFEREEMKGRFVFAKPLNDSTNYIRIRSFEPAFAHAIDSVIRSNDALLRAKPYLVLDLRYNGGGSDGSFEPLLPYIYTNPVNSIGVDIYCTPANVIAQQRLMKDYASYFTEEDKKEMNELIGRMKENSGQLISSAPDGIDTLKEVLANPRKIAVVINEGCASTTEEFLLWARQSKKVVLVGQHTAGVLDYSNVRQVDFPCIGYTLGYPTTRSRRIPNQAIDNVGIQPNLPVTFDKSWLKKVIEVLGSK